MFQVASNVEPGVLMPLIVFVLTVVTPAFRRLVAPPLDVPTNVPPALTNACKACAGVPADPTGVVAEIVEPGSISTVYDPLCRTPLDRSVEVS